MTGHARISQGSHLRSRPAYLSTGRRTLRHSKLKAGTCRPKVECRSLPACLQKREARLGVKDWQDTGLCAVQALRELSLADNQLQDLPPSCASLQSLARLWTYGNCLRRLPADLLQLPALKGEDSGQHQHFNAACSKSCASSPQCSLCPVSHGPSGSSPRQPSLQPLSVALCLMPASCGGGCRVSCFRKPQSSSQGTSVTVPLAVQACKPLAHL